MLLYELLLLALENQIEINYIILSISKAQQYTHTHTQENQACTFIYDLKLKNNELGKDRIPRGHRLILRLRNERHVAAYVERIKFALL
jgi:hypothetical protein